jgi:RNA polymerase sigma factor (sigma-70 family)
MEAMASDEELAGRIVRGDEAALEELLGRYSRPLASFISRHTGGHDVEDLHQETWIRVVGAIDSFDRQRKFSTWIFRIAINLCRDRHRRYAARPSGSADSDEVGYTEDSSAALDAQSLLALLPVDQREAIVLRYYHDLSEAEMADVIGVPQGTVKSRLHAGLSKLSKLAADEEKQS